MDKTPDTGGEMATDTKTEAPRVIARFQPQAWINDYAVDIDGGYYFDVTEQIEKMSREKAEALMDCQYETDRLWRDHPINGERPHTGPFSVYVEESVRDYFEALDQETPTAYFPEGHPAIPEGR